MPDLPNKNPPFRAEHIGSFMRPPELLRARDDCAAGKISADALRAAENVAIKDFVALQQRLGFKSVTDGEFRRATYTANFTTEGISGVTADHDRRGRVVLHRCLRPPRTRAHSAGQGAHSVEQFDQRARLCRTRRDDAAPA